ncbi:hypothetical protein BH11BAC4_BH11BAC4_20260 [soil metagenome]
MPIVVFDFDKTLTKKDTVLGFLTMASSKTVIPLRLLIQLFFAVLHKLKFISNEQLKKAGVDIFLKGMPEEEIKRKAGTYSAGIELNNIYKTEYLSKYPAAIIVTASFEDYVRPLFPGNLLIGAKLGYSDGLVSGLAQNAYGNQKVALLHKQGVDWVDIFYTDSFSDQALMDISTVVYLVKNNDIKKIKG